MLRLPPRHETFELPAQFPQALYHRILQKHFTLEMFRAWAKTASTPDWGTDLESLASHVPLASLDKLDEPRRFLDSLQRSPLRALYPTPSRNNPNDIGYDRLIVHRNLARQICGFELVAGDYYGNLCYVRARIERT